MTPIPFDSNAREALGDPELRRALRGLATVSRERRQLVLATTGDWESLRERAREIKEETLRQLDHYLEQFVARAEAAGATVHWAETAEEACATVVTLARQYGATMVAKSKSMLSEEIHLNRALDAAGIRPVETDLGEWILQLAHEVPSHIVVPAIHKTHAEIARLFAATLGTPPDADAATLTAAAREALRPAFASAVMGVSGVNFGVAETGSILVLENEGNARLVTSLPRVHVALMGIEKVIPRLADLDVFLKLLPRAGTGQRLTTYQSVITGVVRSARDSGRTGTTIGSTEGDAGEGPGALHIVLVDHGRSRMLRHPLTRQSLSCIRCGACLNVCPVYQQVGGHAYGSVYPGPIGAVITPQLTGLGHAAQLPYASSLCGACRDVCPVKIDIPALLLHLRARETEGGEADPSYSATETDTADAPRTHPVERFAFRAWRVLMRSPWAYRSAARAARLGQRGARRVLGPQWDRRLGALLPPLGGWTAGRDLRPFARRSFRELWGNDARLSHHPTAAHPGPAPGTQYERGRHAEAHPAEAHRQPAGARPAGMPPDNARHETPPLPPRGAAILRAVRDALAESERADIGQHGGGRRDEHEARVRAGGAAASHVAPLSDGTASDGTAVDRFTRALVSVGGSCVRVRTVQEGADALVALLHAPSGVAAGAPALPTPFTVGVSDDPLARDVLRRAAERLRQTPYVSRDVGTLTPDELFSVDVGITGVQWGVAETGTLALVASEERNRLLSLVPPIHVAVLPATSVRDTLAEVLDTLQGDVVRHRAPGGGAVTLITGPSRTSDIELTLVVGVHGPKLLHVIVVDEPTLTPS